MDDEIGVAEVSAVSAVLCREADFDILAVVACYVYTHRSPVFPNDIGAADGVPSQVAASHEVGIAASRVDEIAIVVENLQRETWLVVGRMIRVLHHDGIFQDEHILIQAVDKIFVCHRFAIASDVLVAQLERCYFIGRNTQKGVAGIRIRLSLTSHHRMPSDLPTRIGCRIRIATKSILNVLIVVRVVCIVYTVIHKGSDDTIQITAT